MQRNYFSILFFIKKTKLLKNGEAPICLRITVNGKRAEVQIKRSIEVGKWNAKKECANGKERKYQELNHYLETVRTKVLQIHRQLEQDNKPITADILKRRYYGEGESPKMLLEVFNDHNKKCRDLLGKDFVLGTGTLELSENLPVGSPIQVTFTLSTEGILEVSGVDKTTGREVHATMQAKGIMAEEKVDELKEKSKQMVVM